MTYGALLAKHGPMVRHCLERAPTDLSEVNLVLRGGDIELVQRDVRYKFYDLLGTVGESSSVCYEAP